MTLHPQLAMRWAADEPAFGGWMVDGHERAIEAYMAAGFDYVGIDCQHSLLDEASAAALIRRNGRPDVALIARSSANEIAPIGKLLDSGADAVIVPGINTAEEAAFAVSAFKYPPTGIRSYGAIRIPLGSGPDEIAARAMPILMIETTAGMKNLDDICAVKGVGGIFVGPADLSIALGLPVSRAFTSDQLVEPMQRIADACRRNSLVLGSHASTIEAAARWVDLGCRFVSYGSNVAMLNSAASSLISSLRGGNSATPQLAGPYG
jgi:4-hydroxy-2-oxoheptanedioate aldolase